MTDEQRDQQIDQVVRAADPYDGRAVDVLGADQALLEEIMSTSKPTSIRRRLVTAVAVAAAATAAIGIPAIIDQRSQDDPGQALPGTTQIQYSAAAIRAAERNPRLLIDEPGWKVTTVYGFTDDQGTIAFAKGDREIEMNWYSADSYQGYIDDRAHEMKGEPIELLGRQATVFSYSAHDFEVMVAPDGPAFVALRTGAAGDPEMECDASGCMAAGTTVWDRAELDALLANLHQADVQTWLAAMPPAVVTPGRADQVLTEVMEGIPTPPGFSTDGLVADGTNDRYQFGALVTGAVTCGWIEAWEKGDAAAKAAAVKAMGTSRDWKILQEMAADGGYPDVVWAYADDIAAGKLPEGYRGGLGCQ